MINKSILNDLGNIQLRSIRASSAGTLVALFMVIGGAATLGVRHVIFEGDNVNVDLTNKQESMVDAGFVDLEELRQDVQDLIDQRFDNVSNKVLSPSEP